ncbi:hypothetical protein [Aquibacillus rhizosphaerae]|uniref:DUF4181 domain-containing protein n=1 Tax=Aquibacillus rhizosphaerae TaxID=3051431 RepID=A0ABT7L0R1_9BACI|nr:hypothetical protein [Aquibacillus sp. LR5S19]MDL4839424.1 hypothetical protein [Aquibacillus sp. LR5S19]
MEIWKVMLLLAFILFLLARIIQIYNNETTEKRYEIKMKMRNPLFILSKGLIGFVFMGIVDQRENKSGGYVIVLVAVSFIFIFLFLLC